LVAFPANASAVILMEVIDPLTLFKVEGLTFETYSTSEQSSLRIENTDTGLIRPVDILGQTEPRADLVVRAVSRLIPEERVLIEIDIRPLQEAITPPFVDLVAVGRPGQRAITDVALGELVSPLVLGLALESETIDPLTGDRRTSYRLESVRPVPEPACIMLAAVGGLALVWCWTSLRHRSRG
jgi:hypothetical protein